MSTIVEALRETLGEQKVQTDDSIRTGRRHDYWMLSQLDDLQERAAPSPACVVRPEGVADVVTVVNACRERAVPLIPFGLGSGVCGAVLASSEAVVLDMSSMAKVRAIDPTNLTATFEAGVRGSDAERAAADRGLTLGHFPQSIDVSSVGGWVATRAAGQFSTGYGNIEDVVLSLEAVLPSGQVLKTKDTPRASAGIDLKHLLLGSEGTLGVITAVTFSARRKPEKRACSAFYVRDMRQGFELQREVLQSGWQPVVMRQYDSTETARMFSAHARNHDGLLLLVHEGPEARVDIELDAIAAAALSKNIDPAPSEAASHWLAERNHVPAFQSFLQNGVVVDTIEIAATWDKIAKIYDAAVASLAEVPGLLTGTAHSSHVYRSGVNLYFTFAAQPKERADMRATYLECWRRVMQATTEGGGGIAHHHGIGRVRRAWLEQEIGTAGVFALRQVKHALDPVGFMNPGALIPD